MPTSKVRSDEYGDGVPFGGGVWRRVNVEYAVLWTKGKNSTLTIYVPLSIREKVSKVGTVILRDYLTGTGYSPSVISVINKKVKKRTS